MLSSQRRPWVLSVTAAAFLILAQTLSLKSSTGFLPSFEKPAMMEYALSDTFFVMLGLRRLGADLAFIQLLQYYGTPPEELGDENGPHARGGRPHGPGEVEEGHDHVHLDRQAEADLNPSERLSEYPRLLDLGLRVQGLDPYFRFANLFSAGALGFNLNRDDEAVALLKKSAATDPQFWQYRLYAAAIAYRKNNEIQQVINLLEEAVKYPDCPSMLQNILAGMHKKQGNFRRAAEIYFHTMETSRDIAYATDARKKLEELARQHPEILTTSPQASRMQ